MGVPLQSILIFSCCLQDLLFSFYHFKDDTFWCRSGFISFRALCASCTWILFPSFGLGSSVFSHNSFKYLSISLSLFSFCKCYYVQVGMLYTVPQISYVAFISFICLSVCFLIGWFHYSIFQITCFSNVIQYDIHCFYTDFLSPRLICLFLIGLSLQFLVIFYGVCISINNFS